ncbi:MAG: hypothetical protein V4510_10190 [bacterium]
MRRLERTAGWLSIAAAGIHGGVAPQHFAEWWGYGAFFLVAGVCQGLLGLLLVTRGIESPAWPWERARRPVYLAGILGNLAILALWAVTRTIGIPAFGPGAGEVEPVTTVDAAATLVEAVLVVLLARLWLARAPQQV